MSDSEYGTAAGSGNATASSTKAYHNGGVEGASFEEWYSGSLEGAYSGTSGSAAPVEQTVLDLSDAGALKILNLGTNPDNGKLIGTVEFLDADGAPVGWGHFWYVDDIKLPETPDAFFYDIGDLEVIGDHGAGKPPKVSLERYYSTELVTEEEAGDGSGSGSGGTKGSGSGGTKGTGSGGTEGSGSGGTMGSGSGGTKGTGSGGTKGTGSGGTKGTGSGGTKGTGSGGTKGSGSGGTKGTGSGGTKGSGSGGTKGSGSGGTKGSGSGGTKGTGSGGTKGTGSGGTKGSGSGGTKGTGSGGTKGSGSGGTKGTGSAEGCSGSIAQQALLPAFAPHPDDAGDLTGEDMIALMTQPIPGSASGGTEGANDWDEALGDALL